MRVIVRKTWNLGTWLFRRGVFRRMAFTGILGFSPFLLPQVFAQTIAQNYKDVGQGNPISPCVFCADPTALEYNGRLYVYGTNDHQQYIRNGKKNSNGYGDIKSLVVFSTNDMANWTFHGTIDVSKVCTWAGNSWAPSAVWRTNDKGVDEFFIYFANGGGSVGVMKGSSPVGPFTSPNSQAMIRHGMAGVDPCNWLFDPGAVIDENGQGWIAFGGGDPQSTGSKLWPGNSRIAKLKPSMTALDGAAKNMPAPYLFEASELNMMNGRYVYTYKTSWSDRNDWNKFEGRNGQPAPSTCSMCYMVSDTPLDPDSWEYRGEYVPNEGSFPALGSDTGNNHTHLHKFGGNYYLFYHGNVLEKSMKNANAMDGSASGYRSLCVNKIEVDEETQTIEKVKMTKTGPPAIATLNPYEEQQAETMSSSGGINYEDFTNVTKVPNINSLGNDASKNLQIKIREGAWTMVRNVDFGTQGATKLTIRAKGTGKLEVRLNGKAAKTAATLEFSSTTIQEHSVDLDPTLFTGTYRVFFVFTSASSTSSVLFDSWQFFNKDTSGINNVEKSTLADEKTDSKVYSLSGRQASSKQGHGIVIEQYTDKQGVRHSSKRVK